jgi:serine protease AprX
MKNSAAFMKAATLRALMINSADEAGDDPGPDYKFGWGLINAEKAVQTISGKGSFICDG